MKKAGVFAVLLVVFLSVFVIAQSNQTNQTSQGNQQSQDSINSAYQCLEDLIDEKTEDELSLQEAIFSTLALGSRSKLNSVISSEEGSNCWPDGACTVKETAQVLMAKKRAGQSSNSIQTWLEDQSKPASEITWYLQLDISNHIESSCTLTYDNTDRSITVREDMTLSGNPGSCFSISSSGFWLRANSNCLEKEFRISCDEDFVTSLLYQRQGSSTVFVSPNAHSSAALGTTTESIDSKCFGTGNSCDYEGTLWAALALDNAGEEVSAYLPYLLALAEENGRFFPSSFLHFITKGNDQYSKIIESQIQGKYWQMTNTPYNRFYDTSLAMLSLKGTGAQEFTSAQQHLLSIRTPEGCWNNNNIRDTAFVLYSGWGKTTSSGSGGSAGIDSCVSVTGRQCVSLFACSDAGGTNLGFDCDTGICCSVPLIPPSCAEQGGLICSSSQECSGTTVSSSEGSCCVSGACLEVSVNECQQAGGSCHSSCIEGETQNSASCGSGQVCCIKTGTQESSSSIWIWIVILFVLIALIVLAILYRKKLQLMWFNFRNKKGKSSGPPSKPMPPRPMGRPQGFPQRPMPQRPQMRPQFRKPSQSDKELDETLKKLREMSG